jgi:hypothetical protein
MLHNAKKLLSSLVLLTLLLSFNAFSQTSCPAGYSCDAHFGMLGTSCTNTNGRMQPVLKSNRWFFCTPEGHLYWMIAMAGFSHGSAGANYDANITSKYGSEANWTSFNLARAKSWNWNGVGQLSAQPGVALAMPTLDSFQSSLYASANLWGYSNGPAKNLLNFGVNTNYDNMHSSWHPTGGGMMDFFDPNFAQWHDNYIAAQPYSNDMYIGIAPDDTDFFWGMGSGPDFIPDGGVVNAHSALVVLIASPIQTFNPGPGYNNWPYLYSDSKVYSKTAMASPPTTCDMITPCALRDYLSKRYSTIQACAGGQTGIAGLNNCWGSNYTTFDSTGTNRTVTFNGDGTTKAFSSTLFSSVSPLSIAVKVNGNLVAGDCPYWNSACQIDVDGVLKSPNRVWQAGIGYYTQNTIIDSNGNLEQAAAAGGVANAGGTQPVWNTVQNGITCDPGPQTNPCGGASITWTNVGPTLVSPPQPFLQGNCFGIVCSPDVNFPHASYFFRITYHYSVAQDLSPSRGVGETSVGQQEGISGLTAGGNACTGTCTGYDVYASCKLVDTNTPAFGCVGNSFSGTPAQTLQASNIAPGSSWFIPDTGVVNGTALPVNPSTITYATGALAIKFQRALAIGESAVVSYVQNGWMYGTGVMDEDGRNSAWVGHSAICLSARPVGAHPGDNNFYCDNSNFGDRSAPDANVNLAIDIDEWLKQVGAQYFKSIKQAIQASFPNLMYFGPDGFGTWGVPPRKQFLAAAAQWMDGCFPSLNLGRADAVALQDYVFNNFTRAGVAQPCLLGTGNGFTTQDSSVFENADITFQNTTHNQEDRGKFYYDATNSMLNYRNNTGLYPWIGLTWFAWTDFEYGGEVNNLGLLTRNDNPYDGVHDCNAGTGATTETVGGTTYTRSNETVPGGWQAATLYTKPVNISITGSEIRVNVSGTIYMYTPDVTGTSGGSQPNFASCTAADCTISDGATLVWHNRGVANIPNCYGNLITGTQGMQAANALWIPIAMATNNVPLSGVSGATVTGATIK